MQNFIVFIAIAGAALFTGWRLWQTYRNPKNINCGCGCSGCTSDPTCSPAQKTLPRHKP
ncbi:MAG: FeoB-associated Cys-rich membrane protein [Desulfobulbaceae bacterium]|nr:FeoB-associated Cys-rich membrane protein [Desulfobulbaceae bacterium]